jgi:colanic acid biosynthesis glycosyl transferase WcaI
VLRRRDPQRRPRLLVLNQYYRPGLEATAHLLADLCGALSEHFEVTVVTGRVRGGGDLGAHEVMDGVRVIRVRSTAYDRSRLSLRAINYATYVLQTLRVALKGQRPDVVMCMTDPPIIGDIALIVARRFRVPLVAVSQDVFPEIAVELRRLENPVVLALLDRAIKLYLRNADAVVAIGETMRERLHAKGVASSRIHVIPNWVDTKEITPQPRDNEWARSHDLADRFVVMHSGNIGHAQSLDTLIRASTFLRDLDRLVVMIIGTGARLGDVSALADRIDGDKIRFLPYQPREVLPELLASADIHFLGLGRRLSGYVVPSRLYGILAAERPVIVSADADSEAARLVERIGFGVRVPAERPELVAAEIRRAYSGELPLEEMGRRGREYAVRSAERTIGFQQYRELLLRVITTEGT